MSWWLPLASFTQKCMELVLRVNHQQWWSWDPMKCQDGSPSPSGCVNIPEQYIDSLRHQHQEKHLALAASGRWLAGRAQVPMAVSTTYTASATGALPPEIGWCTPATQLCCCCCSSRQLQPPPHPHLFSTSHLSDCLAYLSIRLNLNCKRWNTENIFLWIWLK